MDKLIEYVCDELKELEKKADKDGKLSMAEIQYADTLAHMKKNLLKGEEMYSDEYSMARDDMRSYRGGSYGRSYEGGGYSGESYARGDGRGRGRNARRDSMGRYSSRDGYINNGYSYHDDMMGDLRALMEDAPDDKTRHEFKRFIEKMESM